ncbi:MAG TPA: hypothetical protein VGW38_04915 [Chloroflexota bacterium]|nr:hypothetical protein [Chloroflexota bacterium]
METGLQANDACALPLNPVIDHSAGWFDGLRAFSCASLRQRLVLW